MEFVENRFKNVTPILFHDASFGMWQIVQKYLNKEQDTFSEIISVPDRRRNLVQKLIFLLIICINRNADTSNNFFGFLYVTLRWQPSAQCPAEYFKVFKKGVRCCFWGPVPKATGMRQLQAPGNTVC